MRSGVGHTAVSATKAENVQEGNGQEMLHSERNPHSKIRGGKN